ncbi:transcriptional regulator, TetR family [Flavobacteriaceae bacterium MAR_2010_188]|nr:transcriptional regulator, TetR family [Flavobacteriaceae bacterium MAR_2010_188]
MHKTKDRIIEKAVELFNSNGLVNVRLQQIADLCEISVGNLAYHYYSKKAIIIAIDQKLEDEIMPILSVDPNFPSLIDFDNHLSNYYHLIKQYSFYFLDVLELERAYPKLHSKRINYIEKMIDQIENWLILNSKKEVIKDLIFENQFRHTALTIWILITFWLTQEKVRGSKDENEGVFKTVIWNQLLNLFTENGLMEYEVMILPQLKYYSD